MSPVSFEVVGSRVEPHAAAPTLVLRLRITATSPQPIAAMVLRAQIMIDPKKRRYTAEEESLLTDLFGDTPRWGETLRPFLWMHVSTTVTEFTGSTEVDLPIACTYDFDVAAAKYLHALGSGEVPLIVMFSGTVFGRSTGGSNGAFSAAPISWSEEASCRLPVEQWRQMMDLYFPNGGWLRLQRTTLDALQRFKAGRGLLTWDEAVEMLLKQAGEDV
jgi:hypothetical protein